MDRFMDRSMTGATNATDATGAIGFVFPTRDRPSDLARTLDALGRLRVPEHSGVLVIDNNSASPAVTPSRLPNGLFVSLIRLDFNAGAAGRNLAIQHLDLASEHDWLVLLDDDSAPSPGTDLAAILESQPPDVAAVTADIHLPNQNRRESGGLPEVPIGCGVAIRAAVFAEIGGYDESFGYYAEEYDLAAKLIAAGHRVAFDHRFRVEHRKADAGRDMNLILARLIRNNGWVMQRWAPERELELELEHLRTRYRAIAEKENAVAGFERGLAELERTIADQPRTPLTPAHWDRFTGLTAARRALAREMVRQPFDRCAITHAGKNERVIRRALAELTIEVVADDGAVPLVIGTMSPGPMLDALDALDALDTLGATNQRVIAPWPEAVTESAAPARSASPVIGVLGSPRSHRAARAT
ncbi:MAG: glycosyltransferase [Planctomycetota bacterium]